jgi:hypothetical protein
MIAIFEMKNEINKEAQNSWFEGGYATAPRTIPRASPRLKGAHFYFNPFG